MRNKYFLLLHLVLSLPHTKKLPTPLMSPYRRKIVSPLRSLPPQSKAASGAPAVGVWRHSPRPLVHCHGCWFMHSQILFAMVQPSDNPEIYNIGVHAQWFRVNRHPWQWSGSDEWSPIAYWCECSTLTLRILTSIPSFLPSLVELYS